MKSSVKSISKQFYQQSQSWNFVEICKLGTFRLKVDIRRNAYDEQSYVNGYVLDPVRFKWNLLVHRPIQTAACKPASYVNRSEAILPFERDCESVICEMEEILVQ